MWEYLWNWAVGRYWRNFDNDSINHVKHTLDRNVVKENTTSEEGGLRRRIKYMLLKTWGGGNWYTVIKKLCRIVLQVHRKWNL